MRMLTCMHVSAKLQEQNRLQTHRLKKRFTSRSLHVTERWKLCMTAANLGRARAGCVLRICNFGSSLVSYGEGLHLQQQLAQLCKERAIVDTVLLLQVTYCLFPRKRLRFLPTSFGVQQWTCARSTHQCIPSESVGATRTFLQRQSSCGLRAQRYTRQTVAERSLFTAQGRQAICKTVFFTHSYTSCSLLSYLTQWLPQQYRLQCANLKLTYFDLEQRRAVEAHRIQVLLLGRL